MNLKDLSTQLGERLPATDDMLRLIGLQQQRTASDMTLSMLGAFALGTLVGGAMGLLFAPKTGEEMRRQLGERLDDASHRVKDRLDDATHRVKDRFATNSGDMTEHGAS
jgi:hypothetical protein